MVCAGSYPVCLSNRIEWTGVFRIVCCFVLSGASRSIKYDYLTLLARRYGPHTHVFGENYRCLLQIDIARTARRQRASIVRKTNDLEAASRPTEILAPPSTTPKPTGITKWLLMLHPTALLSACNTVDTFEDVFHTKAAAKAAAAAKANSQAAGGGNPSISIDQQAAPAGWISLHQSTSVRSLLDTGVRTSVLSAEPDAEPTLAAPERKLTNRISVRFRQKADVEVRCSTSVFDCRLF